MTLARFLPCAGRTPIARGSWAGIRAEPYCLAAALARALGLRPEPVERRQDHREVLYSRASTGSARARRLKPGTRLRPEPVEGRTTTSKPCARLRYLVLPPPAASSRLSLVSCSGSFSWKPRVSTRRLSASIR